MPGFDKQGFFDDKKKKEDTFIHRLKDLIGKKVNIEYECSSCCKRATGGILEDVGHDFVELKGQITIVTAVPGLTQPIIKKACVLIIPIENVCAVEQP